MRRLRCSCQVLLVVLALVAGGCGGKSHKVASTSRTTTSTTGDATTSSVAATSGTAASTGVSTTLGRSTTVVPAAPGARAVTTAPPAPATTAATRPPTTAAGTTQTVHATGPPDYGFTPMTFSVAAGSKVVVVNDSQAAPHTWTADDGSFDSGTVAAGGTSAPITLSKKGTYGFYCQIHGAALMHGTVTVT